MTTKEIVIKLHKEGEKIQNIAILLELSRQRIYQIIAANKNKPVLSDKDIPYTLRQKQLEMQNNMLKKEKKAWGKSINTEKERIKMWLQIDNFLKVTQAECVFYVIQPDPVNYIRVKFGISTNIRARIRGYLGIVPDLEVISLYSVPRHNIMITERDFIKNLTLGVADRVSNEVYDIVDNKGFIQKIEKLLTLQSKKTEITSDDLF